MGVLSIYFSGFFVNFQEEQMSKTKDGVLRVRITAELENALDVIAERVGATNADTARTALTLGILQLHGMATLPAPGEGRLARRHKDSAATNSELVRILRQVSHE
jgi:hypothetical protein